MIIDNPISVEELKHMATEFFGDMVKAVVDIDRGKLAINSELHSDLERLLLEDGSEQEFLWGINLYPEYIGTDDFIEFDSLINIRPWQNNRSRYVEDALRRRRAYKGTNYRHSHPIFQIKCSIKH